MHPLDLSIIVAMTPRGVIGSNEELPWYLPSDLKHFKKITTEVGTIIMGRKTFDSILKRIGKPLPGRKHIVLSRKSTVLENESACFVKSVEEACAKAASYGTSACVIGGGEIYKLFLANPAVSKMYVTVVYTSLDGDTHFPIPESGLTKEWECMEGETVQEATDEYKMTFFEYHRRQQ